MPRLIFILEFSRQKARQFLGAFLGYESLHKIAHDFQFPYSLDEVEVGDAGEDLFGSGYGNSPGRLGASEGLYLGRKLLEQDLRGRTEDANCRKSWFRLFCWLLSPRLRRGIGSFLWLRSLAFGMCGWRLPRGALRGKGFWCFFQEQIFRGQ